MAYKLRYDSDADVLSILLKEGKLSHADQGGDVVLRVGAKENPLYIELLNASKIVPMMVEAMAKGELVAE